MRESTKARLVAEVDHAELTARLLEIGIHLRRAKGQSGAQVMSDLHKSVHEGRVPAYIVNDFQSMATAAIEYMSECIDKSKTVQ